jgi:hypothetical protein
LRQKYPNYQAIGTLSIPHLAEKDDLKTPLNETRASTFDFKPRLLQIVDASTLQFVDQEGNNVGFNLVKFINPGAPTYGQAISDFMYRFIRLGFASPFGTTSPNFHHNLSWNGDTGLRARYYQTMFEDLSNGYECTCTVLMTPFDYNQMQINRPINYDGNIYYIKEIKQFNPVNVSNVTISLYKKY